MGVTMKIPPLHSELETPLHWPATKHLHIKRWTTLGVYSTLPRLFSISGRLVSQSTWETRQDKSHLINSGFNEQVADDQQTRPSSTNHRAATKEYILTLSQRHCKEAANDFNLSWKGEIKRERHLISLIATLSVHGDSLSLSINLPPLPLSRTHSNVHPLLFILASSAVSFV